MKHPYAHKSAQKRGASSALMVLTGLFFVAGLSRLGLGVAEVIAAENDTAQVDAAIAQDPPAPDPGDLFQSLRAREARLQQMEERLEQRAEELRQAEADIRAQLEQLAQAEERLLQTLALTESAAEDDVARLTAVYEHMKPQQAAELFSQMDVQFAAGFFARLRPDFAGAVMASLDPMTAYSISAVLAGRNANTPRD
ncbi:MotE family protein [Roseinatronobacter sp. NSM]|uniref:MotE family protein n=1 Tax=Roseinatronobacter sp. NSM TaxID=3457785 RepID=UPI004036ED3F